MFKCPWAQDWDTTHQGLISRSCSEQLTEISVDSWRRSSHYCHERQWNTSHSQTRPAWRPRVCSVGMLLLLLMWSEWKLQSSLTTKQLVAQSSNIHKRQLLSQQDWRGSTQTQHHDWARRSGQGGGFIKLPNRISTPESLLETGKCRLFLFFFIYCVKKVRMQFNITM